MPVFTSIGLALGASATAAFAVGGAAALAGTAVGVGAYAAGGGFDKKSDTPSIDSRVQDVVGTGELTEAEAQTAAKKRAFRSGVLFTSPTGLDSDPRTSSAKLR